MAVGVLRCYEGHQYGGEMIVKAVLNKVGHLQADLFCMSFETTPELGTKNKSEISVDLPYRFYSISAYRKQSIV